MRANRAASHFKLQRQNRRHTCGDELLATQWKTLIARKLQQCFQKKKGKDFQRKPKCLQTAHKIQLLSSRWREIHKFWH